MAKSWNEVVALPAYQALTPEKQERLRNAYFDEVLAPALDYTELATAREVFDAETAPPEPPQPNSSLLGDVVDLAQKGAYDAAGGVLDLAGLDSGAEWLYDQGQAQEATLTPETRAARAQPLFDDQGDYYLGAGFTNPRAWLAAGAETLGGMALPIPGGALAKAALRPLLGLGRAATVAKEALVAGGLTERAATAAARQAAPDWRDTAAMVAGYGGLEGAVSGGLSEREVRERALALPWEQVQQDPAYWQAVQAEHGDLEAAKVRWAEDLGKAAGLKVALPTALLGAGAGHYYDKLIGGGGTGSRLRNIGQGATTEALEEVPQAAVETLAQNQTLQQADPNIGLTDGLVANLLTGAALGGLAGGTIAGVMPKGRRPEGETDPGPVPLGTDPTTGETLPPGVDPTTGGTIPPVAPGTGPEVVPPGGPGAGLPGGVPPVTGSGTGPGAGMPGVPGSPLDGMPPPGQGGMPPAPRVEAVGPLSRAVNRGADAQELGLGSVVPPPTIDPADQARAEQMTAQARQRQDEEQLLARHRADQAALKTQREAIKTAQAAQAAGLGGGPGQGPQAATVPAVEPVRGDPTGPRPQEDVWSDTPDLTDPVEKEDGTWITTRRPSRDGRWDLYEDISPDGESVNQEVWPRQQPAPAQPGAAATPRSITATQEQPDADRLQGQGRQAPAAKTPPAEVGAAVSQGRPMDLAAAGLPSPEAGLETTAPGQGAPGLRRKMGGLAALGLPGADAGLGTAVVGEGAPVTSRDIAQQARREAAAKYEARYQERINRMQSATTPAAVEAILTQEEYQDPERHIAGTHKVEQAAKDAKRQLAAEATRAEAEAQGKWVTLPGFYRRGTRGELQAELEALPKEAGFEYQLGRGYSPFGSNGQDNDFVIERRKVAAPEAANSPAGVVSSEPSTDKLNSSEMPISSAGIPTGAHVPEIPDNAARPIAPETPPPGAAAITKQSMPGRLWVIANDHGEVYVQSRADGSDRWVRHMTYPKRVSEGYDRDTVALAREQLQAQGVDAEQVPIEYRAWNAKSKRFQVDKQGGMDQPAIAPPPSVSPVPDIQQILPGRAPEVDNITANEEAHVDQETGESNPVTTEETRALAAKRQYQDAKDAAYREQVIVEAERLFEQSETAANLQTPPGQAEPTAKQRPFGPIFRQFYHDAQGAIAHLRQTETGEAVAALHHPEVGDIDLVWGHTSDDPRATGEGLAKLARWHPEVLDDLQGFIDSLHVHQKHKNYIHLTDSKDRRGAVRLDYNGQTKTWLLTAYEVGKQGVRSAPGGISASAGMKDATILATASGASDTSSIDDSKSARVILELEPEDDQHSPITVEINQVNRWVNALSDADYATLDAAMADSSQARFPYGATLTADPQQVQAIWEKELAKQGAKAQLAQANGADTGSTSLQVATQGVPLVSEERSNLVRSPSFFEKLANLLKVPVGSQAVGPTTNLVDGKPSSGKSRLNSVRAHAKFLGDILEKMSLSNHSFSGLDAKTQRLVLAHVVSLTKDPKVFDAIVELIPVDVMDYLITAQLPPQVLFQNNAVLKKALSHELSLVVSHRGNMTDALIRAIALAGAEVSSGAVSPNLERPASNTFSASRTIDSNHGNNNTRQDGVSKLQTREDDAGNVALFSKRPQGKQTSPLTIEDAEYLAAVQRGDMETARRLVDEAARAAGYTVAGWHGSRGWGFSVFKTGSEGGVHFGTLPQAEMRGGRGNARRFWLKMESTARLRDRGQFKAIPRGRDSAIYLNRYEGISVETVESIPGAVLDRLTDAQFKKRVPEAADSQLVKYAWQIKSADPVTYDDNGQVIPLSQRFDPANDDVRFAKSAHAPGAGGSVTAITQAVRRLMRPWANAPRPVVFQGMNDPQVDAEVRQAYAEESARRQAEDPQAKPDLVEGFYFRGQVYINAEAVRNVADLERVLRHETLGHAGLRGLFGGPELDALLDRLARARRGEVAAMATARGLDMMDQTQRRQAAEEVLAELAQTRPEMGWVRDLLALIKAKLREWGVLDADRLSDAEILREYVIPARNFIERGRRADGRMTGAAVPAFAKGTQENLAEEERQRQAVEARYAAELRAHDEDGKPLLAPNGQPSKLNRRQWVEVRTENFKRWFGDWEIAATQDWLDKGDPVAVMEGNEVPKLAKLTDLAIWVAQNWQSRLGANAVTHPQLGAVTLDRKAVGTSLAHGFGPEKMQALYLVPQALAAGRVLGSLPREQNKPEAIMVAAPVEIGGRLYRMLMEVRRDANMQRLYVHEVILREAPSAAAFISSAGPQGLKPQGAARGAIWKFMQGLRDVQAASSKVVDANGEPLLIYHGTQSDFSKFNNELVKSRFPYSIGLHFTDRPGEAGIYADGWENHAVNWNPQAKFAVPVAEGANIMPVFVRATNPLAIDAGPQSASTKVDMDRAEIIAQLLAARQNGTPYDGVIAKRAVGDDYDGINVIVFDPTQIKSAIGNTGAFDPTNPDVRFSLARDADAGGSPLGGGKAFLDSARQWLGDSWQGRVASENYSVLGALTLRQLAEVGAKWLPGIQLYDRRRTTMETRRNVMMEEAGRLGDGVDSWARKHPAEARAVFELENETTLAQVDPSDYQVLMIPLKLGPGPEMLRNWAATAENVQELRKRSRAWRRSKQVRERELAAYYSAAADKLNLALRAERRRQAALPELARKWAALSSGPQHRGADGAPFATEQAARAALTARRWPKGVVTVVETVPGGWAIQELGGQQVYTRMRDLYKKRSDEMLAALIKRLESLESLDEASKQALAARIRAEFENPMDEKGNPRIGPYFPLQRFGRFYLTARRLPTGEARTWRRQDGEPFASEQAARSALRKRPDLQGVSAKVVPLEDGTGFVLEEVPEFGFWLAESVGERRKLAAELVAEGWRIQGQGLTAQAHKELQGVSEGFMAEAVTQLQEQGAKEEADMLYQMYLQTLTQMSIRKHFIHRKGTTGYTADQLRAYGWNMTRLAHQVSKLEHLPNLERVIRDIEAELKEAKRASQGLDTTRQNAMLEELKKRHDWVAAPENAPWTNALSALGFVFYLGVSPAAALVNLSQVPIVGLPVLAARYGSWSAAAKGLTTAFVDVARGFNPAVLKGFITGRPLPSDAANLTEEERRAFAEWDKTGARDRTQAHNLAGIGDADNWLNGPTFNRVMGAVSSLFHAAEVVNRDATLLAAYRLGRAKGLEHETAVLQAEAATWEAHFDYANANRARMMQGNVAKVLLMFKNYSQHVLYFLGRNLFLSVKGESAEVKREARTKFAGMVGMTALFAGAAGLPVGGLFVMANLLQGLFGDDDEPWDAEIEFRNWLAATFPEGVSDVLDRGAVNTVTGLDFSSRVSIGDLIWRAPDRDLDGAGMFQHVVEQMLGPVGGLAARPFTMYDELREGRWVRAAEAASPKFLRDLVQSGRFAEEGVLTRKGAEILAPGELSSYELFAKALGMNPDDLAVRYQQNSAIKLYEQRITDRRRVLVAAAAMAIMAKDTQGQAAAREKIAAFNKVHPEIKISVETLKRSVRAREMMRERAKGGIAINPKLDYLREQAGGFGEQPAEDEEEEG